MFGRDWAWRAVKPKRIKQKAVKKFMRVIVVVVFKVKVNYCFINAKTGLGIYRVREGKFLDRNWWD